MKYRKLDSNGDYTIGTGQDFYVDDPQAVAQAVKTRLELVAGEWYLDNQAGFPWDQYILGKLPSSAYDVLIKAYIRETHHVQDIIDYNSNLDRNARRLNVDVTISTDYGQAALSTVL